MGKKKESKLVKYLLIGISILFLFVMLVLPLIVVVTEALKKRMAGLCGSGDRFFYDRCTDADVKSNSHCGIM